MEKEKMDDEDIRQIEEAERLLTEYEKEGIDEYECPRFSGMYKEKVDFDNERLGED